MIIYITVYIILCILIIKYHYIYIILYTILCRILHLLLVEAHGYWLYFEGQLFTNEVLEAGWGGYLSLRAAVAETSFHHEVYQFCDDLRVPIAFWSAGEPRAHAE